MFDLMDRLKTSPYVFPRMFRDDNLKLQAVQLDKFIKCGKNLSDSFFIPVQFLFIRISEICFVGKVDLARLVVKQKTWNGQW